jgi:hypothetical protein
VKALTRPGSESRIPPGAQPVVGDALDGSTFVAAVAPTDTFVPPSGLPIPARPRPPQFRTIDLVSAAASVAADVKAAVRPFAYVSVAPPAPVMKASRPHRRKRSGSSGTAG